jgi:hypothetical protein
MKKIYFFIILFIYVFSVTAFSPAPTHNTYGGRIYFRNTSSHDQYWEIDLIDNPQGGFNFDRICLERNDVIRHNHTFQVLIADDDKFDKTSVDPNKHFKEIRIYDMDTGTLLKEFHAGDEIFKITEGNLNSGENCVWNVDITDALLTGE